MAMLHAEVARNPRSKLKRQEVRQLVQDSLSRYKNPAEDFCLDDEKNAHLKDHVTSINFCSLGWTYPTDILDVSKVHLSGPEKECNGYGTSSYATLEIHVFELNEDGENPEFMDDEEEGGQSPASHHWILPSRDFVDLWDSLIFDSEVKTRLLDYIETTILYSERKVNDSLISWNKVILLHGPPGTGKTSLCKALAQKATIRLGSRYRYGQLVEINSHSLFSKWFSESGKLVMKMFDKIQELIEDRKSIVFLLIDEVESLAQCRISAQSGNEPSDSIRAVNALLTQIDRIKKYPNVMILSTSNVAGSLDLAFVDRSDIKIFIGNPPVEIIYKILASSINELIRVGIIVQNEKMFLPTNYDSIDASHSAYKMAQKLFFVSKSSVNLSGRSLRKIPFLAHLNFVRRDSCSLDEFMIAMEKAVSVEKAEASAVNKKFTDKIVIESNV